MVIPCLGGKIWFINKYIPFGESVMCPSFSYKNRKEENMLIQMINQLRDKLESALAAEEMDRDKVLKLSIELDKYIVEYMMARETNKKTDKDNNSKLCE